MAQTQPNPTPSDINHDSKAAPRDAAAAKNGSQKTNLATDPLALLSADHRSVEQLFDTFEKTMDAEQKSQLAKQICTELVIHALLEEEIFYPACEDKVELKLLDEAQVEHDGAKALIIEIQGSSPTDRYYDALVKVLSEDIKHHVREEEKPDQGIFAKAKEAGVATAELAAQLVTRKQKLMEEAKAESLGPPETRSLRARIKFGKSQGGKEPEMARGSSSMDRERDDRGRFVSDDDDDDRRGGPRSRSREDDDDNRRSSRSRDDEGRFTSSRSRSRDDDDDDRGGGRGRGHGGWFGDPEGHSRASREGWDDRGGSRSRSREDDDDNRRSSRSRDDEGRFTSSRARSREDDDDDRRSSRSRDDEGRFTSSRSRSRDDDDDDRGGGRGRGHGGWFGDPEGHSRASREGWDDRGGSRSRSREDDDDNRRSSRSRDDEGRFTSSRARSREDDDDDRRSSRSRDDVSRDDEGRFTSSRSRSRDDDDDDRGDGRGRGHGGWFGDPEGHAEAARQRRR